MQAKSIIKSLTIAVALLSAGIVAAQSMGTSAGRDLDALWAEVQGSVDLDRQDAALLLESRQVTVAGGGDVTTRVHRVVWIGTSLGIRHHADLRVPWHGADADLAVEILRTWRDGRWWPDPARISETAVVHTLPYALDGAADYTDLRETMLLHDGVELPCIMETAYTITEHGRPAADGVFVLPQADPAALVELRVQVPPGRTLAQASLNGAPAPSREGDTWTWTLRGARGLARPLTATPAAYEPTVAWSTWESPAALVAAWRGRFDEAAAPVALAGVTTPLRERLRAVVGDLPRLRAVAAFVAQSVRSVHYDPHFWQLAPRPADRVWATGYGHALDRAVLMAAVLADLGYEVEPVMVGTGPALPFAAVAGLAGLGDLMLGVRPADAPGSRPFYYDPVTEGFHGPGHLAGRPVVAMSSAGTEVRELPAWGDLSLAVVVQPDTAQTWRGSGQISAGGSLNFGDLAVVGRTALGERVAAVAASVLAGATVTGTGVQDLTAGRVAAEFAVALPAGDGDQVRFVVGAPQGGVRSRLPDDVVLSDAERASPVLSGHLLSQDLELRLDLAGRSVLHRPADRSLRNEVGEFTLSVEIADGWLVYHRTLVIGPGPHAADRWPALRSLLLEESDEANGTIVLSAGS